MTAKLPEKARISRLAALKILTERNETEIATPTPKITFRSCRGKFGRFTTSTPVNLKVVAA
jgi:hypothetical protein